MCLCLLVIFQLLLCCCSVDAIKVAVTRTANANDKLKFWTQDVHICLRYNARFEYRDDHHVYCLCRGDQVFFSKDEFEQPKCHDHTYAKTSGCECQGSSCIESLQQKKLTLEKPIINKLCANTRMTSIEYWDGKTWSKFWSVGISMNVSRIYHYPMLNFYMSDPYVYFAGHLMKFNVKCRLYGVDSVTSCLISKGAGTYTYEDVYDPLPNNKKSTSSDDADTSDSSSKTVTVVVCCIAVVALAILGGFLTHRYLAKRDEALKAEQQQTRTESPSHVNYNYKEEQPPKYFMNYSRNNPNQWELESENDQNPDKPFPVFMDDHQPKFSAFLGQMQPQHEPDYSTLNSTHTSYYTGTFPHPHQRQQQYPYAQQPYPMNIQPAATITDRI